MILNQIFVNYFYCGQKTILTSMNGYKETNRSISPAIQNGILKDMAMHTLRPIVKSIKETRYYNKMKQLTL